MGLTAPYPSYPRTTTEIGLIVEKFLIFHFLNKSVLKPCGITLRGKYQKSVSDKIYHHEIEKKNKSGVTILG